jgi:hypothetical protein
MKKKTPKPITLLESEIQRLPDVTRGRRINWTPLQDEMILKYCPTKGQPAVAAILGVKYETLRRRYMELKKKDTK